MWHEQLTDPLNLRLDKPRTTGLTMVMDKGLGLSAFKDMVTMSASYIDFIKLGFGTAGITPIAILEEKISIAKKFQVPIFPGGTFFEVAKEKNLLDSFFQTLTALQFEWVEISDGSIALTLEERNDALLHAKQYGLHVITEIGKKSDCDQPSFSDFLKLYEHDIKHGSSFIIIEGRESGQQLRIFDSVGEMDLDYIKQVKEYTNLEHLIWEAPQKDQQVQLLETIGSCVNFGNIAPGEILSVESLRRGLRSDTFFMQKLETKEY